MYNKKMLESMTNNVKPHVFTSHQTAELSAKEAENTSLPPLETMGIHTAEAEVVEKKSISILGLGYVGAVSSACFAELGHKVIGVDPDWKKVTAINTGVSPIVEKGLAGLIGLGNGKDLLKATVDTENAIFDTQITLVSVGTPSDSEGGCDLRYLSKATEEIGVALKNKSTYHLVVFRSTVPPGTTRDVLLPLLEYHSGKRCGLDFGVCFNPEFLRESTAIDDFFNPAKTVIGAFDDRSAQMAKQLYRNFPGEILLTELEAAEYVKYVDNTWHALKVSFANEIGRLCKAMTIDSELVMDIFSKDTKLNISPYYLKPGFAFGGSCLPKDTKAMVHLAQKMSVDIPVIQHIISSNDRHLEHSLELIRQQDVKSIGIVGLTFKANTGDLRDSPSLALMKALDAEGYKVSYLDRNVSEEQLLALGVNWHLSLSGCSNAFTFIDQNELIVIANHYPNVDKIAQLAAKSISVIDLVGLGEKVRKSENYQGLCW